MSGTDEQELQEIFEHAPVSLQSAQDCRKLEAPTAASPKELRDPSGIDFSQWEALGNGVFYPTGQTESRLPPGAYVVAATNRGIYFQRTRILTDSLVDLDNSNSTRVISGIKLFWTRRERYRSKGIVYKRGVLLWGPPGSGKTATLAFLVRDLIEQGGLVLLVQQPEVAIPGLVHLRRIEPERPLIVVLEDIEEIILQRGEHLLLALLDGEHQTENVVSIATTNYPEMLGPRIVNRPSRFDQVIKIGMPSPRMREQYLRHLLGEEVAQYPVLKWVEETEGMSIAHLKELVIAVTCLDQLEEEVVGRLKAMKSTPKSTMYEKVGFQANRVTGVESGHAAQGR